MNLLLDTHTFIWFIAKDPKISQVARNQIINNPGRLHLSIVSLWEIAIKVSIGKLSLHQPYDILIPQQLTVNGIRLLDIKVSHTSVVSNLSFHHTDPFDRMLIAQAIVENMAIVSTDSAFDAYSVQRLW